MKKVIVLFLLGLICSIGFAEDEISKLYWVYQDKPDSYIMDIKIKKINDIDYINSDSLAELVKNIYGVDKYEKTKGMAQIFTESRNFESIINIEKNTMTKKDKNKLFFRKMNMGKLEINTFDDNITVNLDKYSIKLVEENGEIYIPLFLVGHTYFDSMFQIYKVENGKYWISRGYNLRVVILDKVDRIGVNVSGKINKEAANITLQYFINLVKDVYPGVERKKIDIQSLRKKYEDKLSKITMNYQLNYLLADICRELKDAHINLLTFYSYDYSSSNENLRSNFSEFYSKNIDEDIGYINIPTWNGSYIENGKNIDEVIKSMMNKKAIIIDERTNGGGLLENANAVLKYFTSEPIIVLGKRNGKIAENLRIQPSEEQFKGKLIVLTNKADFSCATYFPAVVKMNKLGIIIGEKTAGGGYNSGAGFVLPNNHVIALPPEAFIVDKEGNDFEDGVNPDILFEENRGEEKDKMLEKAISYIREGK